MEEVIPEGVTNFHAEFLRQPVQAFPPQPPAADAVNDGVEDDQNGAGGIDADGMNNRKRISMNKLMFKFLSIAAALLAVAPSTDIEPTKMWAFIGPLCVYFFIATVNLQMKIDHFRLESIIGYLSCILAVDNLLPLKFGLWFYVVAILMACVMVNLDIAVKSYPRARGWIKAVITTIKQPSVITAIKESSVSEAGIISETEAMANSHTITIE